MSKTGANLVPVIGAPTRILFSFLGSGSDLEADCSQECVEIVRDALVQAVELAALLFGQEAVVTKWRQQAGGERCVDLFEELEEDEADGVALADQSISTGVRDSFQESFGAQFGQVI